MSQYWTGCNRRSQWFELNGHIPEAIEGESTYFSVHPSMIIPPKNSRGEIKEPTYVRTQKEYVAAVNCLYGEFDDDIQVEGVPPASVVVESSPGHYHKYWLLNKPFVIRDSSDLAKIDAIQKRWVAFIGSDPGAKDLARVLRLPGYMNKKDKYKRDDGTFPTVDYAAADFEWTYTISDLEDMLPEPEPEQRQYNSNESSPSETGEVRAAYNRAHSIEDAASRYLTGYTSIGKGVWSRPGDKNSAGAKIQGDKLHIYSSNDPLHPSQNGDAQAYDAFGLFAHFEHNGDNKAAWTEAKKSMGMWEDRQPPIPEPPTIDDEPEWMAEHVPGVDTEQPQHAPEGMWTKPLRWDDILDYPPVKWEVDQVFAVGDNVGMIFGPSGEGKTFVTIDLLISLVKGRGKWAGKFAINRPMNICYATGEGFNGIPPRLKACADHYNLTREDLNRIQLYKEIPILTGQSSDEVHIHNFIIQQLQIQSYGSQKLDVLVLDTLHNAAPGAQENDNTEMGLVIRLAKLASKELGCLVLLVHHAGKNGDYRGASALRGDMNFMLKITGEKKRKMEWFKTKEGENWGQVLFDLKPHMDTVIIKWEGDNPILSAIIEAFEFTTDEHLNTGSLVTCLIENVGMGKTASENAVKQMVSDGWIKQVKSKGSGKNYILTHKAESLP